MLPGHSGNRVINISNCQKKVLVVDDSLLILKLIEKFLKNENYIIMLARDAGEALEILDTVTPDIVLLDILLPDIDGYNMLKILKLRQQTEDVPVIFISSLSRGMDISKGLKLGAEDYIIKPFTSTELKNKVQRAIKDSALLEI